VWGTGDIGGTRAVRLGKGKLHTALLAIEFLRNQKFSRSGSYFYCEVPPVRFHSNPQPSPFTLSPFHPFTHSPIHPFTHSPIHPFTPSPLPAFCRFSLPFLSPLLVAASGCRLAKQNHCALQYRRPIADAEGIGELKSVSHCAPSQGIGRELEAFNIGRKC